MVRVLPSLRTVLVLAGAVSLPALGLAAGGAASAGTSAKLPSELIGSWTLVAADVRHPDGSIGRDYGDAPKGSMQIDRAGRYTLLIYKSERPKFASGDKATGTAEEYRETVLGMSTHFGLLGVDPVKHVLSFKIAEASFANWNGTVIARPYELNAGVLNYTGAARPNGDVPVSVWKKTL